MKKTLFYIPFLAILLFPVFVHADVVTYPDGCTATTKYSATTGQPCQKPACSPGDLYSYETGQKCSDINTNLPEGCIDTTGYSPLTGHKCDGSVPVTQSITPVIDTSTQSVSTGTQTIVTPVVVKHPDIKLKTYDLGDSYEFHAYIFDENGNNIDLTTLPDGSNQVSFYPGGNDDAHNDSVYIVASPSTTGQDSDGVYIKAVIKKQLLSYHYGGRAIRISSPYFPFSKMISISDTLQS